jgi:hypothetical protein
MRWWKLLPSSMCKKSFHSQVSSTNSSDVYILGGMSMKDQKWVIIHFLKEVTMIIISDNFTYTEVSFNLTTVIPEHPFITNFSSWENERTIFVYSGFIFPKYDPETENLFLLLNSTNFPIFPVICSKLFLKNTE